MLLEDEIPQSRDNNLLVAGCGSKLLVARCPGCELKVNFGPPPVSSKLLFIVESGHLGQFHSGPTTNSPY